MNREYHIWHSPSLNRNMELLVFGHGGSRVLVFPTSMGRYYEWEDRGMMGALGEHIERGWIQLYCVDSVDEESWYARGKDPGARASRHMEYENYLLNEVMPLMSSKNPTPYLITTGASFGAYHAMNFALRHPDITNRVIAMSGLYDIERWAGDYRDNNLYYNCPCLYIPNESDEGRLNLLRQHDIIMAIGREDSNIGNNRWLSGARWVKGLGIALREWDGWAHDWPWWLKMIQLYIGGHD
jgi:esterase/lipase superfamily enzyme